MGYHVLFLVLACFASWWFDVSLSATFSIALSFSTWVQEACNTYSKSVFDDAGAPGLYVLLVLCPTFVNVYFSIMLTLLLAFLTILKLVFG